MSDPTRRQDPGEPAALHESFAREEEVQGSSDRAFGLVFAAVFGLLGGIGLWTGSAAAWGWIAGSCAFLALALAWPAALAPLNRLWLRLALLLYRVVSPVTMAVLFFLVVTPTGLLMRLFGKDPLRLAREPDAPSYWLKREPPGPAPETMRNQF